MNEEARDWCVTKYPFSDRHFYAKRKVRVGTSERVVAENLTREEALAMLATIGKAENRADFKNEYYVYVKELKNERSGK